MSKLKFVYRVTTGVLVLEDAGGNRTYVGKGYSGAIGHQNKPQSQSLIARGPIPCGLWKVGAAFKHQRLGPVSIPLWPKAGTETFKRSAFFIHGDNKRADGTASTGCIILNRQVRDFVNRSGVSDLEVIP